MDTVIVFVNDENLVYVNSEFRVEDKILLIIQNLKTIAAFKEWDFCTTNSAK